MSLCTVCQLICEDRKWENEGSDSSGTQRDSVVMLYDSRGNGEGKTMHDSWEIFLLSLGQDCPICWSIWRIIRSSPLANPKEEIPDGFQTQIQSVIYSLGRSSYAVNLAIAKKGIIRRYLSFDIWKTTEECFLEVEKCNMIPTLHTPETVAQLANKWSIDCANSHSTCHQQGNPSPTRPTRLLDVGSSSSNKWSIVRTEGDTQKYAKYAALSHRWSETTPRLLHKGGYRAQSMYQDRELPQHYQDIVSISRAMTIRYLWIDSLCIFQDSDEDFQEEASIMAEIYENAFLTFSICWDYSSASLFQGIRPRTIPRTPPADHPPSRDKIDRETLTLPGTHVFVTGEGGFEVDVTNSLINQRGWVVQERFLSPRIVYLGNEQLYWECNAHIASEAVPQNLSGKGRRISGFQDYSTGTGHLSWSSIMEAYSKCTLTRQEDKLIAISGLARSLSKRSGHTYFSGIWIEYWIHDLLWSPASMILENADSTPQMVEPAYSFEAPSWLWLGFSGEVRSTPTSRYLEVISSNLSSSKVGNAFTMAFLADWKLKSAGSKEDAFMSASGARLDILCLPIQTNFDLPARMEDASCLKCGVCLYWKGGVKESEVHPFTGSLRLEAASLSKENMLLVVFSQRYDPSLPCFLVPLYASKRDRNQATDRFREPHLQGLVVQQISEGRFKRIASFDQPPSHTYGITCMVLNTVSRQKLGAHVTSETSKEKSFKATFLQHAATQTSSPIFADSTHDARLSWSLVPQIKELSWRKIELV